jgi:hypothetical protein
MENDTEQFMYDSGQGWAETCEHPGQANNFAPLQTELPQKSVQDLFGGGGEKLIFY